MISPYYFVPLNKKVFYPKWWDRVSHDIPFSNGESGEIHIKVTAEKPLYIRNHDEVEKTENGEITKTETSTEFCHKKIKDEDGKTIGKEFYIPGSTLKGMSANVLRVLSFAEINVDIKELEKILAVRDMTKKSLFDKPMVATANGIGLLYQKEEKYFIDDYSYVTRDGNNQERSNIVKIKFDQITEQYSDYHTHKNFKEKRKIFGSDLPIIKTKEPEWDKQAKAQVIEYEEFGKESFIVFNNHIEKKKYEFVIREQDKKEAKHTQNRSIDDIVKDFKKAYFEQESKQGEYWKQKFDRGEKIPIFLDKSNSGNIKNIGLSQLFKLPYKYTLLDAISQDTEDRRDLVKTIFGSAPQHLLKGRVIFEHLKCNTIRYESETEDEDTKEEVLSSPKPTSYPSYIRQGGVKVEKYQTLMDEDVEIAGWKFYPLQQGTSKNPAPLNNEGKSNENVATQFKPLDSGVTFSGTIHYHNLKKEEIGALLSALTFHGNEATHHHVIGMAKPLGYGEISIEIEEVISAINNKGERKFEEKQKKDYLDAFEKMMEKDIPEWKTTPQYTELLSIHQVNRAMKLPDGRDNFYQQLAKLTGKIKYGKPETFNEFVQSKKDREYLRLHSKIFGGNSDTLMSMKDLPAGTKYRYDKLATRLEISCDVLVKKAHELGIQLDMKPGRKLILEKDMVKLEKEFDNV